jgi:hypothetical protein
MFSVSCARNYLSTSKLFVKLFHTNEIPLADIADFSEQILQNLYSCASVAHKEPVGFAFHAYHSLSLFLLLCCSVIGFIQILSVTEKIAHSIFGRRYSKKLFSLLTSSLLLCKI